MADLNNSLYRILDKLKVSFGVSDIMPGSKLYELAESIAFESSISEDIIDSYVKERSLMTASGQALDNIGNNFFGIKRLKQEKPVITETMKTLKFYTNNGVAFGEVNRATDGSLQDIVVPEGTLLTGTYSGLTYVFRTTKSHTLPKSANLFYINAIMSMGDNALIPANVIKSHNFTNYTNSASNLLLVTNSTSIGTGREEETDDNYRYRLINSIKATSSSSYFGIKNKLLTLQGVSNVEIVNGAYGGGTFAVYIQGTTPITSDELLTTARSYMSTLIPAWCSYTVNKPRYIGLAMEISIDSGEEALTEQAVQAIQGAISDNVNNFYGTEFKILTLQQLAMAATDEAYSVAISKLYIYSGSGDVRMYEEYDLSTLDPAILLSTIDKLVIEPNLANPIEITQVV